MNAGAVDQLPPYSVRAPVEIGRQELAQQIGMCRVELDAVEARVHSAPGPAAKVLDDASISASDSSRQERPSGSVLADGPTHSPTGSLPVHPAWASWTSVFEPCACAASASRPRPGTRESFWMPSCDARALPRGSTYAWPVMMRPTSPFASSSVSSMTESLQEPSALAIPSNVAERTNRLRSVIPESATCSNSVGIEPPSDATAPHRCHVTGTEAFHAHGIILTHMGGNTIAEETKGVCDLRRQPPDGVLRRTPLDHCERCLATGRWGGNVVLMIVDAAFMSIGLNYFTSVVPAVARTKRSCGKAPRLTRCSAYPAFRTTMCHPCGRTTDPGRWQSTWPVASPGGQKRGDSALRAWAAHSSLDDWQRDPVGAVRGVGINTYQYLRMMGGVDTSMPDKIVRRVIAEVVAEAGVPLPTEGDRELIETIAHIAKSTRLSPHRTVLDDMDGAVGGQGDAHGQVSRLAYTNLSPRGNHSQ